MSQKDTGQPNSPGPGLFGVKRGVAIAIGASAIFHVTALLVLDGVEPPERPPPPVALILREAIEIQTMPAAAEPDPPAPEPPELIDVTTVPEPIPTSPTRPSTERARFETAPAATADPETAPPEDTASRPPGLLSMGMRHGDRDLPEGDPARTGGPANRSNLAALGLGRLRAADPYVDDPGGPRPYVPPDSGELDPSGGGTHRTKRPGFTGKVAADGSISLEDEKAFEARWKLPNPKKVGKRAARGIEDWYRDPHKQVRRQQVDKSTCHKGGGDGTNNCLVAADYGGSGGLLDDLAEYAKPLENDGDDGDDAVTIPIIGGRTELTDYVMRKVGQDPYLSDKLRWMDATRDERAHISGVHRARQLEQADRIIRKHLERLWARTDLDLAAKRAALFELWDDGAEDGDQALVDAGARTRAHVIGFIRARLPAGTEGAFTAAELETFNRRRTSRARFAPY